MGELNTSERTLYGELAASIAREMASPYVIKAHAGGTWTTGPRDPTRGVAGDIFDHSFQGAFEKACYLLWKLGVAEPLGADGSPVDAWSYSFRLRVGIAEMPAFVANRELAETPALKEVLAAFLGLAAHHDLISSGRESFVARSEHRHLMDLLAGAGFAEQVGDLYRWTDKVAPAMRANYLWTAEGESWSELEEARIERESDEALRTMPEKLREGFAKNPDDLLSMAAILSAYWKDGKWQPFEERKGVQLSGGLELPRRLLEKFKATLGS